MPLNDLTFAELMALRRTVDHLYNAGVALNPLGDVRFDLTPGAQMMIVVPVTMPALVAPPTGMRLMRQLAQNDIAPLPVSAPARTGEVAGTPLPGSGESPLVVGDSASGQPHSDPSDAVSSAAVNPEPPQAAVADVAAAEGRDGGQAVAAARPPVAPVPAAPWTKAEDDRLVAEVASWMATGRSRHAAAEVVAQALGRPVEGTRFRCKTVLADRIAAALAPAQPAPAPALAAPTNDLALHLAELRRKGDWTAAQDVEMLELMGLNWNIADIALEMKLDGNELKRRWNILSDLHEADEGRKIRSFTAAQLLPALQAQQAGKAA